MIRIVQIELSPPGPDTPTKLNGEYVMLANQSASPRNVQGWSLQDAKGHRYIFPGLLANGLPWSLGAGEYAIVHTGTGRDQYVPPRPGYAGTFHFYWGRSWWVWNNEGDTAYLFDQDGNLIDSKKVRGAA